MVGRKEARQRLVACGGHDDRPDHCADLFAARDVREPGRSRKVSSLLAEQALSPIWKPRGAEFHAKSRLGDQGSPGAKAQG